ncbi:MAG TPA: hypothetical protein PLF61_01660, partial [Candidatus Goldiibacteriota bacterium]|nr:hypothetical protein [Candidatus Goldiibacteriota bacterium]
MKKFIIFIFLILGFGLFCHGQYQEPATDERFEFDFEKTTPQMMTYESLAIIWETMDNEQKKKTLKMLKGQWTKMSIQEKEKFVDDIKNW